MATASSNADIQMEALIWLPVDYPSVATVEELLRKRDVLTSGHERLGVDFFDPATYIHNQLLSGTSFCFRYDRNVLSRLVEVVHGKPMSEEHRVACGIQALAQITEAVVEPNIALYELGSGCTHADAEKQLTLFRRIDHTHPQHWADLATGRANRLDPEQLADWQGKRPKEPNYSKKLRHWQASHAACLKIASLELMPMPAEEKMLELIRWMEEDLCFLLPGLILANRYLAPNAKRSGLFKQLRSTDRAKALEGVSNQAWDLTLIYAWMDDLRATESTGRIVILASLDRTLHSIARWALRAFNSECHAQLAQQEMLEEEFLRAWGAKRGRKLLNAWQAAQSRRSSHPDKARTLTIEYTKDVERSLREELLRSVASP